MQAVARRVVVAGATLGLLILTGCGSSSDPGGSEAATLSGTIREQGSVTVLADAIVSIGSVQATTDVSGHFELTGLSTGSASVKAERPGYQSVLETVSLSEGSNSHDFGLAPREVYVLGNHAVFVPRGAAPLRGAIIILGGPVTSGFVTGDSLTPGGNNPTLESSLQNLGTNLRTLAGSARVALLGSRTLGLPNNSSTDNDLLTVLGTAATQSGHPELAAAPVVMFGLSAGAAEASGLAARQPDRAIGLLERVPTGLTSITASAAALAVPTLIMQAKLDNVANNGAIKAEYEANRSHGGLWALVAEPGVGHQEASAAANSAVISWLTRVLEKRLPSVMGDPLVTLSEASGWLGNPTTFEIAAWADYAGDRSEASWLMSQQDAASWQSLGNPDGPPPD